MILVDSSVWVVYFRGILTAQTDTLDHLLGREPLAIGDLFLAEVLRGFDSERDFKSAQIGTRCIESGFDLLHSDRDSSYSEHRQRPFV